MLAYWRHIKDVPSFNYDFPRIILDSPALRMVGKVNRYARGLEPCIWKELRAKYYAELTEAMRDYECIEPAHRRAAPNTGSQFLKPKSLQRKPMNPTYRPQSSNRPKPMEMGNIHIGKLSKEERDECMKKGLCMRCRQQRHLALDRTAFCINTAYSA